VEGSIKIKYSVRSVPKHGKHVPKRKCRSAGKTLEQVQKHCSRWKMTERVQKDVERVQKGEERVQKGEERVQSMQKKYQR